MTNPDWVPVIRRAGALVTDSGGMTCHAAIVSRELGVPCIVGTRRATTVLHDGMVVTVDGAHGVVYEGDVVARCGAGRPRVVDGAEPRRRRRRRGARHPRLREPGDGRPGRARRGAARSTASGCCVPSSCSPRRSAACTRAQLLAEGREREFVDRMAASLLRITRAFAPRPVVYRTIDFRSNEFRGLRGGDEFEPVEDNPMIGYRGCYRYVREPDLFRLELEILARVRDETPNLHLMIPFVRTRWELEACLELVDAQPARPPPRACTAG